MRMRKKPNLDIRYERCSQLLISDPAALKGRWLDEFPHSGGLRLELGCGKGRFTAETAKASPNVFIAALEKSSDAMIIAVERAVSEGISNVRFANTLADKLPDYFAPGEVSLIYINFCDPWPARRHENRRLTSPGFLGLYKQVLKPYGEIHFKTDNRPLFEYSLQEFEHGGFALSEVTRNLHENGSVGVMTDYEAKFHSQGIPINRLTARLGDNT